MHTNFFCRKTLKEEATQNIRLSVGGRVCEVVDWMHVDQCRDLWRALINTVMKQKARNTGCGTETGYC
jgi:hypothetical protein